MVKIQWLADDPKVIHEMLLHDIQRLELWYTGVLNPLNAKLNPICHLLASLGAHHIFHVSRISVTYKVSTTYFIKFSIYRGFCLLGLSCALLIQMTTLPNPDY